jgi:DNA-binding NarL/FixJ family response regulator
MGERICVLLADDHALFRRGLAELLHESAEIEVVGEAGDGKEVVQLAAELQPDVVLLDVHMPAGGGLQAVTALKDQQGVRVLMLTVSDKDEDLMGAIEAGADGYLLKNADPEELISSIRHVAAGRGALSPEITSTLMQRAARGGVEADRIELTPREVEVLRRLAQGDTTAQIGQRLVIAPSTVKTHVHHILRKLDASNRTEAVAKAAEFGLLNRSN